MKQGLQIDEIRTHIGKMQDSINQLQKMCDTIQGSPHNGTELPEAVTALCQELIRLESGIYQLWPEMFGKSSTIVKKYFMTTLEPDMKTVHDFIMVNAPQLVNQLYGR